MKKVIQAVNVTVLLLGIILIQGCSVHFLDAEKSRFTQYKYIEMYQKKPADQLVVLDKYIEILDETLSFSLNTSLDQLTIHKTLIFAKEVYDKAKANITNMPASTLIIPKELAYAILDIAYAKRYSVEYKVRDQLDELKRLEKVFKKYRYYDNLIRISIRLSNTYYILGEYKLSKKFALQALEYFDLWAKRDDYKITSNLKYTYQLRDTIGVENYFIAFAWVEASLVKLKQKDDALYKRGVDSVFIHWYDKNYRKTIRFKDQMAAIEALCAEYYYGFKETAKGDIHRQRVFAWEHLMRKENAYEFKHQKYYEASFSYLHDLMDLQRNIALNQSKNNFTYINNILQRVSDDPEVIILTPQVYTYLTNELTKINTPEANELAYGTAKKAINLFENARSTMLGKERGKYFNADNRALYKSFIHSAANRYINDDTDERFAQIQFAKELYRARGFGDSRYRSNSLDSKLDMLKTISNRLSANDLVIDFTYIDGQYIVTWQTAEKKGVYFVKETKEFDTLIHTVKDAISDPSSSIRQLNENTQKLSQIIFASIKEIVVSKQTLIVVNDGLLNTIPLEILSHKPSYEPLIVTKNVKYIPSLQYYLEPKATTLIKSNQRAFVLSNPTYKHRHPYHSYMKYFIQLPETALEEKLIEEQLGKDKVVSISKANAKESTLKKMDFSRFRYLHFATHGVLSTDLTFLTEPALVMTDEKGENSLLTSSEVEKLNINADLTVLSACNTGSGEYKVGEGVMGLSRSFLVAGSQAVLSSLWEVPSMETVYLMDELYSNLNKKMSPAEALREAKITMMNSKKLAKYSKNRALKVKKMKRAVPINHPYFWAAFIYQGK